MFSGQGSHYFEMGREMFEADATFRHWMQELDVVCQRRLGVSVVDLLYHRGHRKGDVFDRTRLTSPAIFMVEYALARTLIESGVRPDEVFGASLGMHAAACIAGALAPEAALAGVIEQSEILERRCVPGSMVAILSNPSLYADEPGLHDRSDMAGINFAQHFVVAAPQENLPAIHALLARRDIAFQPLAVSHAFHSRWIEAARGECMQLFESLPMRSHDVPLICCAAQGPVAHLSADALWALMRQPIHFQRTVLGLEARGPRRYIDVGPSGSLATTLKYTLPGTSASRRHSVMSPFGGDRQNLQRLLSQVANAE